MTLISYFLEVLIGSIVIYFALPRQSKNFILTIIPKWRREFVVVHFLKHATGIPLTYYIIPDRKTGFGRIENGEYDLRSDNALPDLAIFNKRLHFFIEEGNSIPRKVEIEEINNFDKLFIWHNKIFVNKKVELTEIEDRYKCPKCNEGMIPDRTRFSTWAFRVKAALTTQAYDFIYGEKRQWAFIIAIIAAAIAIIVALYAVSEIQQLKPLIETIYQRTIVGNETLIIKPK